MTPSYNQSIFDKLVNQVSGAASKKRLLKEIGVQVGEVVTRSALEKKPGSQFWRDISNSVNKRVEGDSVEVGASHVAAAFKEHGGTITAPGKGPGSRHAKFLSIPVSPVSKGKNISDFKRDNIYITKGGLVFRQRKAKGGKRKDGFKGMVFSELLFVLKKSVTQKADPWWPSAARINAAIERAGSLWLGRGR
jgi:hypothetical protein